MFPLSSRWAGLSLLILAAAAAPLSAADKPVDTRFLNRGDGLIAYDIVGESGPLIIAVPGMGDLRSEYRFLTPLLREHGYRVVTVDIRGHGESGTTFRDYTPEAVGGDLIALIRHLHAGPAILIGTSFAGGAVAWAAAEAPDLVTGLVLVNPFVRDIPMNVFARGAIWALFAGPWRVAAWGAYYDSLYPTWKPADHDTYLEQLRANLKEPGRMKALQALMAASKLGVEKRLPEVRAPSLVVMGALDPDFADPRAEASLVAQRIRGDVLIIPGAGHYPHAETPATTSAAILSFLKNHDL